MPLPITRQAMWNTGEVDITVWKRTAAAEYNTAAQALTNCEIGTTGLVKKRKGTTLLYNVTGQAQFNSRMYEFVDNDNNHYVVLSANGVFYIYQAPSDAGNVVINTGQNVITNTGANVVVQSDGLTFVQAVPVPYQTGDLDDLDYTQDNDALVISSPTYAPGRLFISDYTTSPFPTFAFEYLNIYPLPAYDYNNINYNAFTVSLSVSGSVLTFSITNPSGGPTGFTTAWIGGQILGGGVNNSTTSPVGYAIITGVSNSGAVTTFTATVQIPFETSTYSTQGSQYSIKQPVWVAPAMPWPAINPVIAGYPAKILFFQNRLWFGNTNSLNNTVFGSRINQPINFDVGTGADTDAIVYTIGQTNSGEILWLNGGKQLEIYCQNHEFACPQNENSALTPSTFSVRQQSSYGSSPLLKPITYINDSYYATKTGKAFINFHFEGIGLTYASSNISAPSSHLVKAPTNRALLRGTDISQDNFIYFLNPLDDTITTFQFASEYKLAALTPATFSANVQLVDICTIDNTIYILKYYNLTEQYTIEEFDDNTRMDCSFSANMTSNGVVTGLSLLEGYEVQVVYQNQDYGQYTVSGGQITVTDLLGNSGAVTIGLLYDVLIRPMYLYSGANNAPLKKQMTRIYVDYYQSLNFYINGVFVPYLTYPIVLGGALVPVTDTAIINPVSGYDRFSTFDITQTSPFDLQILAISYEIETVII